MGDIDIKAICNEAIGRGWSDRTAEAWSAVFAEHPNKSDTAIGDIYGVRHGTVGRARKRVGAPPSPGKSRFRWSEILSKYSHLGNAEIARAIGATEEAVHCARARRGLSAPDTTVMRTLEGDDRMRIVAAMTAAGDHERPGERWLVSRWNPAKAVSTHGRIMRLANMGATHIDPAPYVMPNPRKVEYPRMKRQKGQGGGSDSMAMVVLSTFDRLPIGREVPIRLSDKRSDLGITYALDNLRWSRDVREERALRFCSLRLSGLTVASAAAELGVPVTTAATDVRRVLDSMGEGRVTARSIRKLVDALGPKVKAAEERRQARTRWAIPWLENRPQKTS